MDLLSLEQGLRSIATGGNCLNCQEFIGLECGLSLLRDEENRDVYFWGKLFGTTADYYIAFGLKDTDAEVPAKVWFYAGEDFEFKAIPAISQQCAEKVVQLGLISPLSGDPCQVIEPAELLEEDEQSHPAMGQKMTEIIRVAQMVLEIDFDTSVVPRGAYSLNESRSIVPSSDFKGLGASQASSLENYVHFRPPSSFAALRALAPTDAQFYSNFLDPLEKDLPKGCWAVRHDHSASVVTFRSHCWPGYMAYHIVGTTKFGSAYFGYGQRCKDLPFLL